MRPSEDGRYDIYEQNLESSVKSVEIAVAKKMQIRRKFLTTCGSTDTTVDGDKMPGIYVGRDGLIP